MRTFKATDSTDKEVVLVFRRSKGGMALITVVLIAALVFASIAGIVASVVPENKMIASRSASQRALTAAESGLAQVVFNMRNVDFIARTTTPNHGLEYVSAADLEKLFEGAIPYTIEEDQWPVPDPDGAGTPYVIYQARIRKTSGSIADVTSIPSPPPRVVMTIYSLGTVYANRAKATVLARKAISTDVVFAGGAGVKYGLLAGTSVIFSSSGNQVSYADVWAGGDVTRDNQGNNQGIVNHGSVYAVGQVGPGVVDPATSTVEEGAPDPASTLTGLFATLNSKYPVLQAVACNEGGKPYDGTGGVPPFDPIDPTMPNMDVANYEMPGGGHMVDPQLFTAKKILAYYLTSTDFSVFAGFYSFLSSCDSVLPVTDPTVHPHPLPLDPNVVAYFKQLYTHRNNLFCHYTGNASVTGSASLTDLCGAIYIDGNLSVNNGTIGMTSSAVEGRLTIRVTGDVSLSGATVNANIYASGENPTVNHQGVVTPVGVGNCTLNGYLVTPLDIRVGGTFNVDGSIISSKSVTVTGNVNVTYSDRGLGTMTMPFTVNAAPGSWRELSFDSFDAVIPTTP